MLEKLDEVCFFIAATLSNATEMKSCSRKREFDSGWSSRGGIVEQEQL